MDACKERKDNLVTQWFDHSRNKTGSSDIHQIYMSENYHQCLNNTANTSLQVVFNVKSTIIKLNASNYP